MMDQQTRAGIARSIGLDSTALYAVVGKICLLSSGLVTVLLVAAFFSPEVQGFYFTFSAVTGLQVFAELGLGIVLTNYASHEWANLELDHERRITGDMGALSRLTSLGNFGLRWFMVAAAVVTLVLAIGGYIFFSGAGPKPFSWKTEWLALCVVTGLNLCLVPVTALLEGCNQVSKVYSYRILQYLSSAIAGWAAIFAGAGLWVAAIAGLAGTFAIAIPVGLRYGSLIRQICLLPPKASRLSWKEDIWPMQWRIAVSWASGFLTFGLFTPVLFHYQGAVTAGQMGMTWAFVGALSSVASSWVTPKAPLFGVLVAKQKHAELDRLFWRTTSGVAIITAIGALGIWTFVFALTEVHHPFSNRMLAPGPTGYLLLGTLVMVLSLPMATYLRAHKREPLLGVSVVCGILTALMTCVLGRYDSAEAVAIGYFVVMIAVTPFVALIWYQRRAEWHVGPLVARP